MINWVPEDAVLKGDSGRCIYCGEPASVLEHLIPLCFLETRIRKGGARFLRAESCGDCNRMLGSSFFETLDLRVEWVNFRLSAIDRKVVVAEWTAQELADMGYSLRSRIRQQQSIKAQTRRRASWVQTPDYIDLRENLANQCKERWPTNESLHLFMRPVWLRHHA